MLPAWIVTLESTKPVEAALDDERLTTTLPKGALAGEPVTSCNCTIMAGYDFPSAGRVDGNPYTAILKGTGLTVVIGASAVA